MYCVSDVARYVINYCNEENYSISNLRLQKILYYIQAAFLTRADNREPCFSEKIEAWDFGPVVPDVYHEYKQYGASNIPPITQYLDFCDGVWNAQYKKVDPNIIDIDDRILITMMIKQCAQYTTSTLVGFTHNQLPWIDAYKKNCKNRIISNDSIASFFSEDE